ncbi:hypothetical protein MNB_SV-3-661 [hydrothermal vent metagenome]|uniref:Uncharacterized protein n=1 Tax=hydrothermal vent metagenome TaxID=652676 RepID=A0A1W1CKN3_9ZZZZ
MKIKKPEDEKYFKDVVLNNILEEISTETGVPKPTQLKQKKSHKKKLFFKIIFFIAIAVCSIFVMILFNLITEATKKANPVQATAISNKVEKENWKMPEDRIDVKKTSSYPEITPKTMQKKDIKIRSAKQKQKTQRELAKEALRLQMLQ